MPEHQPYQPYRTGLLTREQLRDLNVLRPHIVVRDTLIDWAVIFAAWAVAALWPVWWVVALAVLVVGSSFYALLIIAHDGLHRRLFESRRANDLWCDATILGSIGAITRLNRVNHIAHHARHCLATDPDRFKYVNAEKDGTVRYLLFHSGLSSVLRVFRNVFMSGRGRGPAKPADPDGGYRARDLVIIGVWQVALIGGLTAVFGWWGYPVLWLLPVYLLAYRADLTRVFAEHSMLLEDADADRRMRLVTYRSNWLERRFFAPHNMNYHMVHHLWPSIPYYNLPRADRLIRQSPNCDATLVWRDSYLRYLVDYWLWRRAGSPAPAS